MTDESPFHALVQTMLITTVTSNEQKEKQEVLIKMLDCMHHSTVHRIKTWNSLLMNEVDKEGHTLPFIATRENYSKVVEYFLAKGFDTLVTNAHGDTVWHVAARGMTWFVLT